MNYEKQNMVSILERSMTLLAATAVAAFHYGIRVLLLCAAAMIISMVTELFCLYVRGIPFRLWHLEAMVSGLTLTMLMPASVPYSVLIISCIFMIIIGRQILGGAEHPIFPAAAVGYCFAQLSQRSAVLTYPIADWLGLENAVSFQETVSASAQWSQGTLLKGDLLTWLVHQDGLPMGSSSLLLLLTAAGILSLRRAVNGSVLAGMLVASLGIAGAFSGNVSFEHVLATMWMSHSFLFAGIYLYSDRTLAPSGIYGLLYGVLAAMLTLLLSLLAGVEQAAVILAVLLQPLQRLLRDMAQGEAAARETKRKEESEDVRIEYPAAPADQ
ncbi:MAG: RnfABCDGE type electron transport complex subunit D [Oscillospiraceae bacterium]|nr:RnfABCDGE type electron transport complex subunit D [Oscillospiraceae bacterium]